MLSELSLLVELDELGNLDTEGLERKLGIIRELDHLNDMEEVSWRQKSRALWLKEGYRYTKFFHHVANSNRKSNSISLLEVDGEVVEFPVDISSTIVSIYSSLFEEPFSWRPSLDGLEFDMIAGDEVDWL